MLKLTRRLPADDGVDTAAELWLPYADRVRSRLRVSLSDGSPAAVLLPRGNVLRDGDLLHAEQGPCVRVRAQPQPVYRVRARADSADPAFDLLRAAYHLGNRHIPLQLAPQQLLLEPDAVLRQMLLRLGMEVEQGVEAFDPEAGAYGGGHRHDHDDTQDRAAGHLGELLSRQAHGDVGALQGLRFVPDPGLAPGQAIDTA